MKVKRAAFDFHGVTRQKAAGPPSPAGEDSV